MKQETINKDVTIITMSIDRDTLELLTRMKVDENRNRSNMIVIAIKEAFQNRHPELKPELINT